jgi:hypothetical protein
VLVEAGYQITNRFSWVLPVRGDLVVKRDSSNIGFFFHLDNEHAASIV